MKMAYLHHALENIVTYSNSSVLLELMIEWPQLCRCSLVHNGIDKGKKSSSLGLRCPHIPPDAYIGDNKLLLDYETTFYFIFGGNGITQKLNFRNIEINL